MSSSATSWTVACQAPLSMQILQARILEWVVIVSIEKKVKIIIPHFAPHTGLLLGSNKIM